MAHHLFLLARALPSPELDFLRSPRCAPRCNSPTPSSPHGWIADAKSSRPPSGPRRLHAPWPPWTARGEARHLLLSTAAPRTSLPTAGRERRHPISSLREIRRAAARIRSAPPGSGASLHTVTPWSQVGFFWLFDSSGGMDERGLQRRHELEGSGLDVNSMTP
ncbi:hypothetical protein BRADI_2g19723v3 [Brachypodium distachyon]|uniref:Uncharacterized protein n=1 Tax=Brachypodium distachyon TaxID=15368 RepID=A0A0Q3IY69_BRADI|nr:hypothetical protein BRADI_2g19723v3 [Brachypodium distachyon]